MSKSPAFQWYAADYLADERVAQLTLEAEGVYVRLLSYCWREGSIPASLAQLPPLCKYADIKVIKAALALFTKAGAPPGRLIHKRLEEERAKQEAFRAKQAEKGAKGGRPRKADEKPEKAAALPQLSSGLIPVNPDESSSISSSTSTSSNEDGASAPPAGQANQQVEANPARRQAVAVGDGLDEQAWHESPLTKPNGFQAICEGNGFLGIDFEYYRLQALDAAKHELPARPRTAPQWRSWVRKFLDFRSKNGPLRKAEAGMPTVPTPKDQLPEPGKEKQGQIIAIQGVSHDESLNRMKVATYQQHYPTAIIHAIR